MRFFISSTYIDLVEYRKYTIEYLKNLTDEKTGNIAAMEYFAASEDTSKEVCLAELEKADIVIGIYGSRFGWEETETGRSMTEIEFDYAIEHGKPVLGFVTYQEQEEKQRNFIRDKVFAQGKNCGRFNTLKEYADVLDLSLKQYFKDVEGYSYNSIWSEIRELRVRVNEEIKEGGLHMPIYEDGEEYEAINAIIQNSKALQERIPAIWELYFKAKGEKKRSSDPSIKHMGWEFTFLGLPNILNSIIHSAMFLRLFILQHKLLTEIWTEDLRKEVLEARDEYLALSDKLYYAD